MTIDPWLLGRGDLPPHEPTTQRSCTLYLSVSLDRRFRAWLDREGLSQAAGLRAALSELLDREMLEP